MRVSLQADLRHVAVLAVDDEPDARDVVTRFLGESGARVLTAGSAAEALAILDRERFDVIVSDIGMAEQDGYDLIRKVRERGLATPAVALTAFASAEDAARAMSAGYHAHVSKPFHPADLIAKIASLTGRARTRGG